jgi:cyclopropane fatty-acyl-phospholipid synthase-like methyltransferase
MTNNFVKQQYNKLAENYLAGRDQFKNDSYLNKLSAQLSPGSTILDIGCGAGLPIDKYFIDHGFKIIGIDISEKQIELAKKNVPKGNFKVEDMSEFHPGEYAVEAVVSFYAIFHTNRETHQEILKHVRSFLKRGGLILITMARTEWEGKEKDFFGGEMFWSHYDSTTNRRLVENANFKILIDEIDTTGEEKHQVILAEAQ